MRLFRDKADENALPKSQVPSENPIGGAVDCQGTGQTWFAAPSQQARSAQRPIAVQHGGAAWPRPNPPHAAAMATGPAAVAGHPAGSYPNGQRRRHRSAFLIRPCNARGREAFGVLDEENNDYRRMLVWSGALACNVRP